MPVPAIVLGVGSVAGPKEGQGPLGNAFDRVKKTDLEGAATWEKAETALLVEGVDEALANSALTTDDIDLMLGGDLLNQLISSNFAARTLGMPTAGLYSACATFVEGLGLLGLLVGGGILGKGLVAVSSHHDTAERQYRYPTELGVQRPPTAQWTVTGAAAAVLGAGELGVKLTHVTFGRVIDFGMKDPNNMGAAMAPAAADTIRRHLQDTGRRVQDYDLIITGDLGKHGLELLREQFPQAALDDGGVRIYAPDQDAGCGGSGAACSALVFAGDLYPKLSAGDLKGVLLVGTGSLHSPVSYQQGESIPAVAHAVALEGA